VTWDGGRAKRVLDVDENISKVQKEVDATEEKITHILVVSEPEAKTEEGLAVMDIQEELDDEGNVLSALPFSGLPERRCADGLQMLGLTGRTPRRHRGPWILRSWNWEC